MPRFDVDTVIWLRRGFWLLLVVVFLACVLRFVWQYAAGGIPGLAPETIAPVGVTQSALPAESHLAIAVAAPLDRRFQGESGPLNLLIENAGDVAGRFSAWAIADGGCIRLETAQAEPKDAVSVGEDGAVSAPVGAHSAIRLRIPIDTACAQEHLPRSEATELAYTWSIEAAKAPLPAGQGLHPAAVFSGLIATSPITVTSARAEAYGRAGQILDVLAKDFTWPVLLAVLGFIAQFKLARRADRQQIFNTLLPSYTELIQSHYLPVTRRMEIVALEAGEIKPPSGTANPELALKRTFCAILLMRGRMLLLFRQRGGILFRTAIGEELCAKCIGAFYRKEFQESTGNPGQCETLAASLDGDFTVQQAIDYLFDWTRRYMTEPLFAGFSAAAADAKTGNRTARFESALELLDLAQQVLTFECDRIYYQTNEYGNAGGTSWYFDPPQFEYEGDLEKIIPAETKTAVKKLYRKYLDGIPRRCKRRITYPG